MSVADGCVFSTVISEPPMEDAGLFTWDLTKDILYADGALAKLFGLDALEAEQGLPIQAYICRVHEDDAPDLAKRISDAIIAKHPTEQNYRVKQGDGSYVSVAAYGRCFRNRHGEPVHYAGIVIPKDVFPVGPGAAFLQ